MDRPVALAAAETDGETSRHVAGSSPGHLELLPDEGTDGCGGSRQRQHQKSASSRPWLSRHELPAAEGAGLGHHKDRIHRFSESRVECALLQIVVQNRFCQLCIIKNLWQPGEPCKLFKTLSIDGLKGHCSQAAKKAKKKMGQKIKSDLAT